MKKIKEADRTFTDRRMEPRKIVRIQNADSIRPDDSPRLVTGFYDVDHFLGGGLKLGKKLWMAAEPGTGKSTLLDQVMLSLAKLGIRSLRVCGEENTSVVKERMLRLGATRDMLRLISMTEITDIDELVELIYQYEPKFVGVDSLQSLYSNKCKGVHGGQQQLKYIADQLSLIPDEVAWWFIGQVTKDGKIAGPKAVEHAMDQLAWMAKDESEPTMTTLRWKKNRCGSTNIERLLIMGQQGFKSYEGEIGAAPIDLSDDEEISDD